MPKHQMILKFDCRNTRANFTKEVFYESPTFFVVEQYDLLGHKTISYNFDSPAWKVFSDYVDTLIDEDTNEGLSKKLRTAINSAVRGSKEGIKVVYHKDGLCWGIYFTFIDTSSSF